MKGYQKKEKCKNNNRIYEENEDIRRSKCKIEKSPRRDKAASR